MCVDFSRFQYTEFKSDNNFQFSEIFLPILTLLVLKLSFFHYFKKIPQLQNLFIDDNISISQ